MSDLNLASVPTNPIATGSPLEGQDEIASLPKYIKWPSNFKPFNPKIVGINGQLGAYPMPELPGFWQYFVEGTDKNGVTFSFSGEIKAHYQLTHADIAPGKPLKNLIDQAKKSSEELSTRICYPDARSSVPTKTAPALYELTVPISEAVSLNPKDAGSRMWSNHKRLLSADLISRGVPYTTPEYNQVRVQVPNDAVGGAALARADRLAGVYSGAPRNASAVFITSYRHTLQTMQREQELVPVFAWLKFVNDVLSAVAVRPKGSPVRIMAKQPTIDYLFKPANPPFLGRTDAPKVAPKLPPKATKRDSGNAEIPKSAPPVPPSVLPNPIALQNFKKWFGDGVPQDNPIRLRSDNEKHTLPNGVKVSDKLSAFFKMEGIQPYADINSKNPNAPPSRIVVDANNQPIAWFHGSSQVFSAFKIKQKFDTGFLGKGYYVGSSATEAHAYSLSGTTPGGDGANIHKVFISLKKPYILSKAQYDSSQLKSNDQLNIEFTNTLKAQGYDGVVYIHQPGTKRESKEVCVFENTQIKSVNNPGGFSPKNADTNS